MGIVITVEAAKAELRELKALKRPRKADTERLEWLERVVTWCRSWVRRDTFTEADASVMDPTTPHHRLAWARVMSGLSAAQVGTMWKGGRPTWDGLEGGQAVPTDAEWAKVAELFAVDEEWLRTGKERRLEPGLGAKLASLPAHDRRIVEEFARRNGGKPSRRAKLGDAGGTDPG